MNMNKICYFFILQNTRKKFFKFFPISTTNSMYMNPRYCSHVLKYEKKSNKITWLRFINCNRVFDGWKIRKTLKVKLSDSTLKKEGTFKIIADAAK